MQPEIEQLQGTWNIATLEVEGRKMGESAFKGSKIIVNGDSFKTVAMGATYNGTLKLDVTSTPKTFDLMFTEGPHQGIASLGIYELDGATWKICLGFAGQDRPKDFVTEAGSGHALETLKREADADNPDDLNAEMARLGGEWSAVLIERDGHGLPEVFIQTGKRVVKGNELTVTIGGQLTLKTTFTVIPSTTPPSINYTILDGPEKGQMMYGIYEFDGETLRTCFSGIGQDRPKDFTTAAGDGRTISAWKRDKR